MTLALWSEFLPYRWVKGDLPLLQAHQLTLYLAIPQARLGDPELLALFKAAQAQDVNIGAWLLLPDQNGYWPNSQNVDAFCRLTHNFLDWLASEKLPPPLIIADLEPSLQHSERLKKLLQARRILALRQALHNYTDPDQFNYAVKRYRQLVYELHQRQTQIMAVTYPLVIDDLLQNSLWLQEILQIPVTPIPWDKISLMTYRTAFQEVLKLPLSAHLVQSYLQDARKILDIPIAAALGVIGAIEKIPGAGGYQSPEGLAADIAAARHAGADEIHVFSLDGMHRTLTPQDWLPALFAPANPTPPTRLDRALRHSIHWGHRLLKAKANHGYRI